MNWNDILHELPQYALIITSFIGSYLLIRKSKKESEEAEVDIASKYKKLLSEEQQTSEENQEEIRKMKTRIKELEDKIEMMQETLEEYSGGIILLINQLQSERIKPVWKPKTTPIKYYRNDED